MRLHVGSLNSISGMWMQIAFKKCAGGDNAGYVIRTELNHAHE